MTFGRAAAGARALLRFLIAAVLLATAAGKFTDLPGFASVLETYQAFPGWALLPLAAAVPLAELGLAAWLAIGRQVRGAALASAAMHSLYGGWAALSLARGLRLPNCGCFGIFLPRPLSWSTVLEDGVMVAASLTLAALPRPSE